MKLAAKGSRFLNCGTALAGVIGLGACGVLMSIHVGNWEKAQSKDKAMSSAMFATYNITLGLALLAMFYAALFNAMKTLMELGRVPLKLMLGVVISALFVVSARVMNNWEREDGEGYRTKKFTSMWEMWVLLLVPYLFCIMGIVAVVKMPSFCTGG
jgi:hypothetical protein